MSNSQYSQTFNEQFSAKANMEPLPDLKIDFTLSRTLGKNSTSFLNFDPTRANSDSGGYQLQSSVLSGNYSRSTVMIGTAFDKLLKYNSSKVRFLVRVQNSAPIL